MNVCFVKIQGMMFSCACTCMDVLFLEISCP